MRVNHCIYWSIAADRSRQALLTQTRCHRIWHLIRVYNICFSSSSFWTHHEVLFVCVEVSRPSQPNGVMPSAVSLPNHTFTGQALSSKRLTSIVHIPLSETDNCPSWIRGRERTTVEKNISWSISIKECCQPRRGSNPRPPGLQSDVHPNEPPRPVKKNQWFLLEK